MTSSYIEVLLYTEPGFFVNKKEEVGCKDASMAAFLPEPGLQHPTAKEFCQYVYIHHYTREDPEEPITPIDPNRYAVVEISIYKRPFPLQHESVVFRLQDRTIPGNDPEDFCILANRNIDAASLSRCLSSCLSSLSSRRSQSQKMTPDAAHVMQAAEPPQPHSYGTAIWTMTIPVAGPTFNLAQLVTLLSAVSRADEAFNLTQKNCYWFTRMVRELVIRIVNDSAVAAAHATGDVPQEIVPTNRGHRFWHTGYLLGYFRLDGYSNDLAENAYIRYKNEYQRFLNTRARISLIPQEVAAE
ncbi:hypothetical protein F5887DRAFT_958206 [Amanita rubescens]|nr:hypothetical protein F5887DRAFT_958206 [Amanita rubescens]